MINEQVLVVPREQILPPLGQAFFGISALDVTSIMHSIELHGNFMERALAEEDERYKQIIPYFIFHIDGHLFVMQRSSKANEGRLAGKVTLGIGGHIRSEDTREQPSKIFEWGLREFVEEVAYSGGLTGELLGFINDDTNPVGRVHLGAAFLIHGDSNKISIRSELASGELLSLHQCISLRDRMESWSVLAFDHLKERYERNGTLLRELENDSLIVTRVET